MSLFARTAKLSRRIAGGLGANATGAADCRPRFGRVGAATFESAIDYGPERR